MCFLCLQDLSHFRERRVLALKSDRYPESPGLLQPPSTPEGKGSPGGGQSWGESQRPRARALPAPGRVLFQGPVDPSRRQGGWEVIRSEEQRRDVAKPEVGAGRVWRGGNPDRQTEPCSLDT